MLCALYRTPAIFSRPLQLHFDLETLSPSSKMKLDFSVPNRIKLKLERTTMEETHSPYTLVFETGLLICLRGVYFLVARHYVNVSLFSDLTSVIREDGACSSGAETPEEGAIALEEAGETSYFPISPARTTGAALASGTSAVKGKGRATPGESSGESVAAGSPRGIKFVGATSIGALATPGGTGSIARKLSTSNSLYPRMSTALFCLSFSESCMLFTLVLFGEAVQAGCVSLCHCYRGAY